MNNENNLKLILQTSTNKKQLKFDQVRVKILRIIVQ